MRILFSTITLFFLLQFPVFATQTIRNDLPASYVIVYYAGAYTVTITNDRLFEYIIYPGDYGSVDFEFGYEIMEGGDLYPISQGLPYRWRIQNTENHHKYKRGN